MTIKLEEQSTTRKPSFSFSCPYIRNTPSYIYHSALSRLEFSFPILDVIINTLLCGLFFTPLYQIVGCLHFMRGRFSWRDVNFCWLFSFMRPFVHTVQCVIWLHFSGCMHRLAWPAQRRMGHARFPDSPKNFRQKIRLNAYFTAYFI